MVFYGWNRLVEFIGHEYVLYFTWSNVMSILWIMFSISVYGQIYEYIVGAVLTRQVYGRV